MAFLINASNLNGGGGKQVADSVCRQLNRFSQINFVVVLATCLDETAIAIADYQNIKVIKYHMPHTVKLLLTGRDKVLDGIVDKYSIEKVLTIFGPSIWVPKAPHLSGFASGQLTPQDSPFYKMHLPFMFKMKEMLRNYMLKTYYKKCSKYLYSENEAVSSALRNLFPSKKVFTVTNYYNQVFDKPELWATYTLPTFDGTTMLSMSDSNRHKNVGIAIDVAKILMKKHPDFKFRFVFTMTEEQFPQMEDVIKEHFLLTGRVEVSACPSLYQQCDIEFQPTLLECFTATYPEAMRMGKPIVTTDLAFARQLCGDAAIYYSALDAEKAADAIYMVANDKDMAERLVSKGRDQLKKYDNYEQRANKLIGLLQNEIK